MSDCIKYKQLTGRVSTVFDGERDVFKVEWDDDTIDFLYKETEEWKSHTILKKADRIAIGSLIEQQQNVLHQSN